MILINEVNITNFLVYALNNMFSNLLSSVNENLYAWLDDLVFINTSITKNLIHIIGGSAFSGIKLLCNALIYGFILYYAISYLLSHITFSQIERPFQFIFKLLLCTIAFNASEYICSGLISICSTITDIVRDLGNFSFNIDISFASLVEDVLPSEYFTSNSFSLFSFDGILRTTITFGFLGLSVSYAIRYILLKVLIIISPFAILSLASSKTSPFFKAWFKNFMALLLLQIFISAILLVCFIIEDKEISFLPSQILHLGMIYTLFKSNSFMKDLIGGFSTEVNLSIPNISSFLKGGISK